MLEFLKSRRARLLQRWIDFTIDHARSVVVCALLLTAGVTAYDLSHFKMNTDLTDMVSGKLAFRRVFKAYREAFPQMVDEIVIVIDGPTPEAAADTRQRLGQRLLAQKGLFHTIYTPGADPFFEHNGLLYLPADELQALADSLARVQPFLGTLCQDFSLRGFWAVIEQVVVHPDTEPAQAAHLVKLFDQLADALEGAVHGRPFRLRWQAIMFGDAVRLQPHRQFIIVQPVLDYTRLYPARKALQAIRRSIEGLGPPGGSGGVKIGVTGSVALNDANLRSVESGIGAAALVSFVMVGLVLHLGLRSGYLVFASLLTLVVGLVSTLGFALFFLGHLNMISIAFAVLFIGLGIDYSVQFSLRYRELITAGANCPEAIRRAARDLGAAFVLCLVTTAIGFYAFVPTAYAGASELGIISGTGMFINFVTNLTVLPALLALRPAGRLHPLPLSVGRRLSTLPEKHAGKILGATLVLGLAGAALLPKVHFDYNPLNLSNPSAEPVVVARELFEDRQTSPWSISVLTDSGTAATDLSQKLKGLAEVEAALTLVDFVPERQSEKLEIIADAALFMPLRPDPSARPASGRREQGEAFKSLHAAIEDRLKQPAGGTAAYHAALERLYGQMALFDRFLDGPQGGATALDRLAEGLLSDLRVLIDRLEGLLQPAEFGAADLPPALTERYVSRTGKHRVQVLPRANLMDGDALKRFVDRVRQAAPQATDAPVTILESGRAIVAAFWRASLGALLAIGLLLLAVFKRPAEVAFILTPLLLAIVLTAAATVLLGMPFNFANIIVVPLLLGTGVDYGIHLVYRFRLEATPAGALLASSTSRAVLFSALTTVMSFGSLAFLRHRGTASMGILLSLCIGFMILGTLVVLPALLHRYGRPG